MPYDEWGPEDPFEFVGVQFPAKDESTMLAMAECLVEEYLRMGWPAEELLQVFRNPHYVGPHMVWKAKGEEYVRELIDSLASLWRRSAS